MSVTLVIIYLITILQSVYVNGSRVEILICFYLDKRCQNKKRASFELTPNS